MFGDGTIPGYRKPPREPSRLRNLTRRETRIEENYDSLTRLPNARLSQELLHRAIQRTQDTDRFAGVLLVYLENYRRILAAVGKYETDLLLCQLARRLHACSSDQVVLARSGPHEFALIISAANPPESIIPALLGRIWSVMHIMMTEHQINFGCNVGTAFCPTDSSSAYTLMLLARSRLHHIQISERRYWRIL